MTHDTPDTEAPMADDSLASGTTDPVTAAEVAVAADILDRVAGDLAAKTETETDHYYRTYQRLVAGLIGTAAPLLRRDPADDDRAPNVWRFVASRCCDVLELAALYLEGIRGVAEEAAATWADIAAGRKPGPEDCDTHKAEEIRLYLLNNELFYRLLRDSVRLAEAVCVRLDAELEAELAADAPPNTATDEAAP